MKRIILFSLAALLLLSSLASCSRRGQYEDQLESKKEAESLDAIPETNDNITGEDAPDYQTPIILKTGDIPFYEGKTMEELQAIFHGSSARSALNQFVTPTGRMYRTYDENMWYYNKLTGNFSAWCSDPLCNVAENENCIWRDFMWILYISDEYIYFQATDHRTNDTKVYRCDHQRNNIEEVVDIGEYYEPMYKPDGTQSGYSGTFDEVEVLSEQGDTLYYFTTRFATNGDCVGSLYALDIKTKKATLLSGERDIDNVFMVGDTVYYTESPATYTWYKTDLTFASSELMWENVSITNQNDQYFILYRRKDGFLDAAFSYDLQTGETHELNRGGGCLSGDYLYYTRNLTDEEVESDPHKEYYAYTWESPSPRPGGSPITHESNTRGAGKIYRIFLGADYAPEECVCQLTYKGVPVRLENIEADGEVLYISFHNIEGFNNFYNPDFDGDEYNALCYGMVDLQNGSVTILELPEEAE